MEEQKNESREANIALKKRKRGPIKKHKRWGRENKQRYSANKRKRGRGLFFIYNNF